MLVVYVYKTQACCWLYKIRDVADSCKSHTGLILICQTVCTRCARAHTYCSCNGLISIAFEHCTELTGTDFVVDQAQLRHFTQNKSIQTTARNNNYYYYYYTRLTASFPGQPG